MLGDRGAPLREPSRDLPGLGSRGVTPPAALREPVPERTRWRLLVEGTVWCWRDRPHRSLRTVLRGLGQTRALS